MPKTFYFYEINAALPLEAAQGTGSTLEEERKFTPNDLSIPQALKAVNRLSNAASDSAWGLK